ncbi:uncharacterized protein C1orf50 homolog isoform X2 [Euwallacea fornicatus]|uniref:uncharacterized protein C1orf50 homolog isoform X2 n=1 Tax=Euwallacea fornicatus TaxID=995702 RepID=UPI0033907206
MKRSINNSSGVGSDIVERENNLTMQTLVNSTGETLNELMDLDDYCPNLKFKEENLDKNHHRDSVLHMAACNFVKKPGHIYHLYEKSCGQKYFSMLSHEDWHGHPPHIFLGSWYLEFDQSWIQAEETLMR